MKKTKALAKRTIAINAAANAEPSCVSVGSTTLEIFKNIDPTVNPIIGTSKTIMIPEIHKDNLLFLCKWIAVPSKSNINNKRINQTKPSPLNLPHHSPYYFNKRLNLHPFLFYESTGLVLLNHHRLVFQTSQFFLVQLELRYLLLRVGKLLQYYSYILPER